MRWLTKVCALLLAMVNMQGHAVETSVQLHKVDQDGSYGYSFAIGDDFFNKPEFNWQIAYSRVEDANIQWNDDDIDFSLDTIDLALSYRYFPKSYNKFINSLSFEFQVGAGIVLTENKFTWPDLQEEKFFSEQGDINPFIAVAIHKELSRKTSMHIGLKHYPSYSEFDDVSSIFIGFTYNFGGKSGY